MRKIKKSKIKKYLIDSVGFLVSRSVCDVIVLGAANIQKIIHVIAHKTKNIKICIEQCLVSQGKRPTSFYILKYKLVVKQFCAKLCLMLTWNVPHSYAYWRSLVFHKKSLFMKLKTISISSTGDTYTNLSKFPENEVKIKFKLRSTFLLNLFTSSVIWEQRILHGNRVSQYFQN